MALTDATAIVVQHVLAHFVRSGLLQRDVLETLAVTYDHAAEDARSRSAKLEAMVVADVARLIVLMADEPPKARGLHLVRNEEPPEGE